ncbi:MAG: TraB/GumN family protein [Bdellovibrionales bacterium]
MRLKYSHNRNYVIEQGKDDLNAYRFGQIGSEEELNSPLVVSRNLAWMPAILIRVEQGRAFFAVGQSHLYGQNGLLNLLARRGYSIQPVTELPTRTTPRMAPAIVR